MNSLYQIIINSTKKITIELIVLMVLLIIIFSHDFHFLWLLYDFIALGSIIFYVLNNKLKLNLVFFSALSYFLYFSFKSGFHLISFVSIWDNIKHLFVLFMMLTLVHRHYDKQRISNLLKYMDLCFIFIFFIQFFLVLFQYFNGYFIDNIAGTFGSMSSHAVGYFTLMYISFLLFFSNSTVYKVSIILLSIIINVMAENTGFFLLLLPLLLYNWFTFHNIRKSFLFLFLFLFLFIFIDTILGNPILKPILYRAQKVITIFLSNDLTTINANRGFLMLVALLLGGWFGMGPGSFSECYSLVGWSLTQIMDGRIQINISTANNFIVEYGVFGLIIWMFLYLVFIRHFFNDFKTKIFVSVLFILTLFYNKLLSDERIIFMIIFLYMFVKIRINRFVKYNSN